MKNQTCYKCKVNYPIDNFHSDSSRKTRISNICKECKNIYKKNYRISDIKKFRYREYKQSAKDRNYLFLLSPDDFLSFWQKPCYYCGDKIETIGLDRIDNKLGYDISNVVPCCKMCNWFKWRMNQEKFIRMCKKIAKHFNSIR